MSSFVSVIIPCYNQARFLAEAVESALNQDYPHKEVIVVNDGSSDNVREVAVKFEGRIVYVEQENKGSSTARNTGIRSARGEYIAFLDSDDVYLPGALLALASYLDNDPDTALVCGDSFVFNESGILGLRSSHRAPKNIANFRWETVDYCPIPSTVMVRRSCFVRTGFFEEMGREGGEDWLMWVSLSLDFNMAYLDHPIAKYRIHGSNLTSDVERLNRGNRAAAVHIVNSPLFYKYPAHFRARLLYYRFATAWRVEGKTTALAYFLRALCVDPLQIPYGLNVIRRGIVNTFCRSLGRSQCT